MVLLNAMSFPRFCLAGVAICLCVSHAHAATAQEKQTKEAAPPSSPSSPSVPAIAVVNGLSLMESRAPQKREALAAQRQRPVLLPSQAFGIDVATPGSRIQFSNPVQKGNLVTVDMPQSTLAPGPGDRLELKMPYPGIQNISLVKVGTQKLRLEVLGEKTLPTVVWNGMDASGVRFAVTTCGSGFVPLLAASSHGEGSARLIYDLDEQGCPYNIRVDQSGESENFDRWAIQSLQQRQYRTNRALKNLRVRLTYELEGSAFQQEQQKRRSQSQSTESKATR
jgi:hypothetical protein